jgi:hypothetical protein
MRLTQCGATVGCGLLLLSIDAGGSMVPSAPQLSDEDRHVVRAALATHRDRPAVLLDSTAALCKDELRRALCMRLPSNPWAQAADAEMAAAFATRNAQSWGLGEIAVGIPLAAGADVRAMAAKRLWWSTVRAKYPDVRHGVQVSAPVYSRDRTRAAIYIESICYGRCGGGSLLLLDSRDGKWVIQRSLVDWTG